MKSKGFSSFILHIKIPVARRDSICQCSSSYISSAVGSKSRFCNVINIVNKWFDAPVGYCTSPNVSRATLNPDGESSVRPPWSSALAL